MSPRNLTQKVRAIVRLGLMEMFGQKKLPCCSKEAKFFAGGAEVDVGGKRKGVYDGIYFVASVSAFISSPNEGSTHFFGFKGWTLLWVTLITCENTWTPRGSGKFQLCFSKVFRQLRLKLNSFIQGLDTAFFS